MCQSMTCDEEKRSIEREIGLRLQALHERYDAGKYKVDAALSERLSIVTELVRRHINLSVMPADPLHYDLFDPRADEAIKRLFDPE